ncbi:MAG: ATP-binding protein [Burkholderiales bacterium]
MDRSTTAAEKYGAAAADERRANVRETALSTRILADQVDQLYRQMPLALGVTIALAGVVVYELYEPRVQQLVQFWGFTTLVVVLCCAAVAYAYLSDPAAGEQPEKWLRWFAIGAMAMGANWGFAGAVFFPGHTDEQQVFLAFVLAGVVASGLPVLSAVWWVYALFASGVTIAFDVVLLRFGTKLFTELGLMVPAFLAVNVLIAYRLNQVFISGYQLRQSYRKLTDDYSLLNQQIEQQLEELLQARREVEASGRKLALFAERAPIAVLEVDPKATILEMNPAAENLFGYAAAELIGRSAVHTLFPPASAQLNDTSWAAFVSGARPITAPQVACIRRDSIEIICEFTLTPLVNDAGDLISVIAQVRDITQQLEVERLKKEFTSTLSHELRTPLTSIIGSLQLINAGVLGEVEKDIAELTSVAERNAQRLLDLINEVLDMEKIESGKLALYPETVMLEELVRESLALNRGFAERFKVRLDARGLLPRVPVYADRKRLLQVLANLISNAAKFSPEGETVEIFMTRSDTVVRVGVGDRGPGIPESFRSRIFGRFAQAESALTRQKGGTGLGLAICKRLIEIMEGRIGFEDREGGGTVFYFELPVQGEAAQSAA